MCQKSTTQEILDIIWELLFWATMNDQKRFISPAFLEPYPKKKSLVCSTYHVSFILNMFHKKNKCAELQFDEALSRSYESLFYIQSTGNLNDFMDEYECYTFRDYYTMTDFAKQPRWRQDVLYDAKHFPFRDIDASKGEKKMIEFFTSLDIGMWIECRLDKYSLMDCQEWRIDYRNRIRKKGIVVEKETSTVKNLFFKPYFILNMQFNNPNDDTYGRLIAPGKKIGRLYHYSSDVKPIYLESIKLLSQDGETIIIRPKTRKGNCVGDNIDGCLVSFEHFLYDCKGMPKVLPIGSTTLLCSNESVNNYNVKTDHDNRYTNYTTIPYRYNYNYYYNYDCNVWALPRKKLNENKVAEVWALNLNGSLTMWNVAHDSIRGWYTITSVKNKLAVVSNYGIKQNWNKIICCNIWYYVSRILLINRQLNQAYIELNVDARDLDWLVFNWYKKCWHFASNCPNWLRTQGGFNISTTNSDDIANTKFCCKINDVLLLSKNSFDRGIHYDNFTNNVKNNNNVNQVPMSPYIYISDCKTFSQKKKKNKKKKNNKDCANSGSIINRSFDKVVIYSFLKNNYPNYFTKYSGFIDDIFGIIANYYGIFNMHSCNVVSSVNDMACMIGFCGSQTRINVNRLILENYEMYHQMKKTSPNFGNRVVTVNKFNRKDMNDHDHSKTGHAYGIIRNNVYKEKWYGIDWHGYINRKNCSMTPVMLLFGLLRHNDKKPYDSEDQAISDFAYKYLHKTGNERCFSGIEIVCLNDNDNDNSNCQKQRIKKWKVTCFENDCVKEMSIDINGDDRIKDNQILRVGDNLEMKVLFQSNSIGIYFYKNKIALFENGSCLNMNMKFGKIDNGCNFEAVVKWYKHNKIKQDDCAPPIDELSFHSGYIMSAVSHPFSFQLFDYNSFNSQLMNGKTKITAQYDPDQIGSYFARDGWQIKTHGVYIE